MTNVRAGWISVATTFLVAPTMAASIVAATQAAQPPPLASHVMTYHDRLGMVVVFGGSMPDRKLSSSLWGWDGGSWHVLSEDGPAARIHAGLAYDAGRDRLVLYGGIRDLETSFADTWEWDGAEWVERAEGAEGPGMRDHHALAYDAARSVVLLFGGQDDSDAYRPGTWSWNGERWSLVATDGPSPRGTHRLVYDSHREEVVVFGGWGESGQLDDTWLWDGERWTVSTKRGPSARGAARAAYDRERRQLVLFGGLTGSAHNGDTWILSDGEWLERDVQGPPPRNVHGMAYDAKRKRVVLFGGIGDAGRMGDLWEWDGFRWTEASSMTSHPIILRARAHRMVGAPALASR